MQLTCPECGAIYEIDDEAIPPGGRRVECSACWHVWRAEPAASEQEAGPTLPPPLAVDPGPAPEPPLATPRPVAAVSESGLRVLRAEAAREQALRRAIPRPGRNGPATPPGAQAAPAAEPRLRPAADATAAAPRAGAAGRPVAAPAAAPPGKPPGAAASAAGGRLPPRAVGRRARVSAAHRRRNRIIRWGFVGFLLLYAIGFSAYFWNDAAAQAVPALAAPLTAYADAIDAVRASFGYVPPDDDRPQRMPPSLIDLAPPPAEN
jgi:predicted Zn finger-like uncharacterized protein